MHLLVLIVPRKPKPHALLRQVSSPNTISATTTELLIRGILATAASGFGENDFEVSLLAADPSLDERGWVLGEVIVELALGIGLVDLLD